MESELILFLFPSAGRGLEIKPLDKLNVLIFTIDFKLNWFRRLACSTLVVNGYFLSGDLDGGLRKKKTSSSCRGHE